MVPVPGPIPFRPIPCRAVPCRAVFASYLAHDGPRTVSRPRPLTSRFPRGSHRPDDTLTPYGSVRNPLVFFGTCRHRQPDVFQLPCSVPSYPRRKAAISYHSPPSSSRAWPVVTLYLPQVVSHCATHGQKAGYCPGALRLSPCSVPRVHMCVSDVVADRRRRPGSTPDGSRSRLSLCASGSQRCAAAAGEQPESTSVLMPGWVGGTSLLPRRRRRGLCEL